MYSFTVQQVAACVVRCPGDPQMFLQHGRFLQREAARSCETVGWVNCPIRFEASQYIKTTNSWDFSHEDRYFE